MRNTLWAALLIAPLATGCTNPSRAWEGIWYLEVPVLDNDACETDIDENYDDAAAMEDGSSGDWTMTEEDELSPSAMLVQVLGGDDGHVFVVIDDVLYPGEANAKSLKVSWTGIQDETYREEHDEGYVYEEAVEGEVIETITLIKDKESGGVHGQYEITSSTTTTWRESDRWKENRVGLYGSQVPSYTYLTGADPGNYPAEVDCAGEDCELSVNIVCDGAVDITGLFAGRHDEGMFAAVEDAGRQPGI